MAILDLSVILLFLKNLGLRDRFGFLENILNYNANEPDNIKLYIL